MSTLIKSAKNIAYENKIEIGKDDPKSFWKIFKEFDASGKIIATMIFWEFR